jgi:hypothetical protein
MPIIISIVSIVVLLSQFNIFSPSDTISLLYAFPIVPYMFRLYLSIFRESKIHIKRQTFILFHMCKIISAVFPFVAKCKIINADF